MMKHREAARGLGGQSVARRPLYRVTKILVSIGRGSVRQRFTACDQNYWSYFLLVLGLFGAPHLFALAPDRPINQYGHRSWKIEDGYLGATPRVIAQDRDSYLWLGTAYGLYRFDGARLVRWTPPTGTHLPSAHINALAGTMPGTSELVCRPRRIPRTIPAAARSEQKLQPELDLSHRQRQARDLARSLVADLAGKTAARCRG